MLGSFLHSAKINLVRACGSLGLMESLLASSWRRRRLAILCYHGVSIDDEHLWDSKLFVSPDVFRDRMRLLRARRCNVLPLEEAIEKVRVNALPERSVVLTFDDGLFDFKARALPILQEFSYPSTVYLTTYYCEHNLPVFRVTCSYLLWQCRAQKPRTITLDEGSIDVNPASHAGREKTLTQIDKIVASRHLSGLEKHSFLIRFAGALGADIGCVLTRRILHLMTPDEVRDVASTGVDFQLHTHRHRTPRDRALFVRELHDNQERIQEFAGRRPAHFCYPSGVYDPLFFDWLRGQGVRSATTCDPGLAMSTTDPLLIPRYVDGNRSTRWEFESWVSGLAAFVPRNPMWRPAAMRKSYPETQPPAM
jgi:peptidoglycan/xylan/chitin deacetylase (PgdA/CDA1 family)